MTKQKNPKPNPQTRYVTDELIDALENGVIDLISDGHDWSYDTDSQTWDVVSEIAIRSVDAYRAPDFRKLIDNMLRDFQGSIYAGFMGDDRAAVRLYDSYLANRVALFTMVGVADERLAAIMKEANK